MTPFHLDVPRTATGGVVTIGNFDGVHRGHQAMLSVVRENALRKNCAAVVVTFDPHPITVLKPDIELPRLSTIPVRTELLKEFGADEVVILPVSKTLLDMTPEQFFQGVVLKHLQPAGMVEGPDFRFGKNREGDTDALAGFCRSADVDLQVIDAICNAEEMISSTRIRRQLSDGRIASAVDLLGHPYRVCGTVRAGAGRGRDLGFPTANLADIEVLLPCDGVYAAQCTLGEAQHAVAISIGPNPTFKDDARKVECHIVDFDGDLYDRELSFNLLDRVRGLVSFASIDELKTQIKRDVAACVSRFRSATQIRD